MNICKNCKHYRSNPTILFAVEQKEGLELRDIPSITPKHLPPIKAWCQRKEYALADKAQAAFRQGIGNSRLKDYYDMYVLLTGTTSTSVWPQQPSPGCCLSTRARRSASKCLLMLRTFQRFLIFAAVNEAACAKLKGRSNFQVETPDLAIVVATIRSHIQPILDTVHSPTFGVAA